MSALPLILALQGAVAAPPPSPLPPPPAGAVEETRFGVTLRDPYRGLEKLDDPAVAAWVRAQATRTREVLDSIPQRAAVLADLQRLERATPSRLEDAVLLPGERILVQRQDAGAETASLFLREADGSERRLLDPRAGRSTDAPQRAISYAVPSPDGSRVVVGIAEGGSEQASAQVIDSRDGHAIDAVIPRVESVSWLPDGSGFVYSQLQSPAPGQQPSERLLNSQARLHRLGQPPQRDRVVFGNQLASSGVITPAQTPLVTTSSDSGWLLGEPATVDTRRELRVAAVSELQGDDPSPRWRPLLSPRDDVRDYVLHGDELYVLSSAQPTRRIERLSLVDPAHRRQVVVPAGEGVIDRIHYGNDALYYVVRDPGGVGMKLYALPWTGGPPREIVLDGMQTLRVLPALPGSRGVLVGGDGWTRFFDVLRVDPQGGVSASGLQAQPSGIGSEELVAEIVEVPSTDGAMVPLSIISRRGTPRDGSGAVFLQGYAAYGTSNDPMLVPALLAVYGRGITRAFCHARGGGEKGEAWYRDGFQASKHHSWEDFNACAEYLVSHGYARSERLGASANSAGGALVGNAFLVRPDLYRAVIPAVGFLDTVGASLRDPNGPSNWPEFGDPNTEQGFRSLLAMSSYEKVRDGTAYPAVLLTHGFNDPRVAVWNSAKMAARLQAASSSGRPVLLDIDYDAGHGIGSSQRSVDNQRADVITFLLWQFGEPGYQPSAQLSAAQAGR